GQIVFFQAKTSVLRNLTWAPIWSGDAGYPLPTTISPGGYDFWLFQYNATSGKLAIFYNSQTIKGFLAPVVTQGTYLCPDITVTAQGQITGIVNGTCGGGGGGGTPAGVTGDVQFNSAGALGADSGIFAYDKAAGTVVAPNLQGSIGGTYYEFLDSLGTPIWLLPPAVLTKARALDLPDEDGMLCVKGGSCFAGGGITASGTPSSGQAAEWVSASAIQGVAVTGTGNYVKATSPTLITPTIAKLANLTSNGFVKTSGGDGTLSVDTGTYSTASSSETLTNKTLDVEATGNSITTVSKLWFPGAGCVGGTAGLLWDTGASNAPTASCVTGTNTIKGVADFPDAVNVSMQTTTLLPADWSGNIDAKFKWVTSGTSGNVQWFLATICVADAETDDPAFHTASSVIDTAKGPPNQTNDATITSVTVTGCAAGELLHLKVSRDATGGNASDTLAATASLIGVELTVRRTQ